MKSRAFAALVAAGLGTAAKGPKTFPARANCSRTSLEVPEALPREKGIASGDMVRVRSARGAVEGRAMVTKRMRGCPKRSLHPAALELT